MNFNCSCRGNCWELRYSNGQPMFNYDTRGYCHARNSQTASILLARREGLYRISLTPPYVAERLAESVDNFIYGVDYDYEEGKLFWTERNQNAVYSTDFRRTSTKGPLSNVRRIHGQLCNCQVFRLPLHGLLHPRNIAVDWLSKKLYIVETDSRRIDVSTYDGRLRTVLIADDLTMPIDVALDPIRGWAP